MTKRCIYSGLFLLVIGCGSGDPFSYVRVSGSVQYEDGALLDAHRITVTFVPQMDPVDGRLFPRSGKSEVNVSDGTFEVVTSHKYGDGIVRGKHKLLIHTYDEQNNPTDVVPPEYRDQNSTPLLVDTAETTDFRLMLPRAND